VVEWKNDGGSHHFRLQIPLLIAMFHSILHCAWCSQGQSLLTSIFPKNQLSPAVMRLEAGRVSDWMELRKAQEKQTVFRSVIHPASWALLGSSKWNSLLLVIIWGLMSLYLFYSFTHILVGFEDTTKTIRFIQFIVFNWKLSFLFQSTPNYPPWLRHHLLQETHVLITRLG
jgi:hypothetical protein